MEQHWKGFSPIASVGVIIVHDRERDSHKIQDSIQLLKKGSWQERRARSERAIRGCHHLVKSLCPCKCWNGQNLRTPLGHLITSKNTELMIMYTHTIHFHFQGIAKLFLFTLHMYTQSDSVKASTRPTAPEYAERMVSQKAKLLLPPMLPMLP